MADINALNASSDDPEKAVQLTPSITYDYGGSEMKDVMFKHIDPNDGDETLKAVCWT